MAERAGRALLAVLALSLGCAGAPAAAQDGVTIDGAPCTDGVGVTVVVDFQELGDDTVLVRCAPDAPADGFAALEQAGIPHRTTVAFPGFLCRIADRPDDDPCDTASPAEAYWSYWLAPAGGDWCYSNRGAANRTPPAGAVEGWSFALDRTTEDVAPPRHPPPDPPAGTTPRPLGDDDCTAGAAVTTTTTAPEAVGQGAPVDLDEGADRGSAVATVAGLAVVAAVAAVAIALRTRGEPSDERPTVPPEFDENDG